MPNEEEHKIGWIIVYIALALIVIYMIVSGNSLWDGNIIKMITCNPKEKECSRFCYQVIGKKEQTECSKRCDIDKWECLTK